MHAQAVELLKLLRDRAGTEQVKSYLDSLASDSQESIRLMAAETILHLGSRSFSHFLNATERYLDTIRSLTPDPPSRRILLDAVSSYWRRSSQMRLVTVDKYIQYGILEGVDIVDWVFADEGGLRRGSEGGEGGDGWTDGDSWEMLSMCLDKHVGRVVGVRNRIKAVDKEDESARARRAAEKLESGEGVGESEDVEPEGGSLTVGRGNKRLMKLVHRGQARAIERGP